MLAITVSTNSTYYRHLLELPLTALATATYHHYLPALPRTTTSYRYLVPVLTTVTYQCNLP